MKSYKSLLFLALVPAWALSSCYHEFPGGGGGGGGGKNGNEHDMVLITATPSSTFSFPAMYWPIGNLTLVDSAGATVPLNGTVEVEQIDFARLQTDSYFLTPVTLPATTFTSLVVQFNSPGNEGYIYNNTAGTLFAGTCLSGTVCSIPATVPGFSANTITVPVTYQATANKDAGIRINFDFSKGVTTAGASGITFDFTQKDAITIVPLPTINNQTSGIDTMDNFTGSVTAVSGTTVSVRSSAHEQRIFNTAPTPTLNDPFSICPQPLGLSCLAVNQNISIDGVVNASATNATFTATEIDFLDAASVTTSELEGVIVTPVANNQFTMILTNEMSNAGFLVGQEVIVALNGAEAYAVDPKNLAGVSTSTIGFMNQADLVLGQTVMVKGGTFNFNNSSVNNPTRVLLRYSSIPGAVSTAGNPDFTMNGIGSFFVNFLNNTGAVATFTSTYYDNIAGNTFPAATNLSVRGLYLNPNSGATQPILAAKIRTH